MVAMRMEPDRLWLYNDSRKHHLRNVATVVVREGQYTPYERPWTWKPLNRYHRQRQVQMEREARMAEQKRSEAILRNLAAELLTEPECYEFKQAIHHFRVSHSVTSLCQQLKPIINTTQKILLLVELTNRMPKNLQEDFHRLCSLQFPNYDAYLKMFTNGHHSTDIPRVIARDSSGKFKIVSRGSEKKMLMKYNNQKQVYEMHSLPGTSVTSGIYSNASEDSEDEGVGDFENKENGSVYVKGKKNVHKVFLNRHEDGSLGLGITGGKEFGTSITINVVEEGGPAASQGLEIGDKILEVNGHTFHDITHSEAVQEMRSAWNLIILVERPNKKTTEESEERFHQIREQDLVVYPSNTGRLGCVTQRLNNETLIVTKVEENSSASKAGLMVGDNIIKIDNLAVHTLSEKQIVMLTNAKRISLTIRREGYFAGTDRDISGALNGVVTDLGPEGLQPPQKQRRMTELSDDGQISHHSTSQFSGHHTAARKTTQHEQPQPQPQLHTYPTRPDHIIYSNQPTGTTNWVLTPKPRESRYTQRRNTHNRDLHMNSYPVHVRSYSEGRDKPGHYIHVPRESRQQSVGASRYVRNRSYSPHRTAVNKIHHDDNVIRAIQLGLEKRQRAIRLSLYQMPDPVDYEWELN